jgi:hypothetical protein
MLKHQQIPEGDAFVEPRNLDTVRGLLDAAAALDLDSSVIRTQSGGYLAPADVVAKWQDDGGEATVTKSGESRPEPLTAEQSTETQADGSQTLIEAPDPGSETASAEAPAKSASKGDWEAYAQTQGYDSAEELTKAELIERYGASE